MIRLFTTTMNLAPFLRCFALLALLLCGQSHAADAFGLTILPSTTTPAVNNPLTYTINVANQTGVPLTDTHVISQFPSSLTIGTYSSNIQDSSGFPVPDVVNISQRDGFVDFLVALFPAGVSYAFNIVLTPTQTGIITNIVTVTNSFRTLGNSATNIIGSGSSTNVTGAADLKITLSGVPAAVLVSDLFSYSIAVTNAGPGSAAGIVVQNTVPPGATLVSIPTGVSQSGTNILWRVGTLASGVGTSLGLTLVTTNASTTSISVTVQASSNTDPTSSNDSASSSIVIQAASTNNLVLTRGTQKFNRANSLFEETALVQNVGPAAIASVRVMAAGLVAPDRLFNASGTNGTTPYVLSTNALAPGASNSVLLQFFFQDRKYDTSQTLLAVQGPSVAAAATNTPSITVTNIAVSTNNVMTFEFAATTGARYSVLSADNVEFANATLVPFITATTNRIVYTNLVVTNANRFFRATQSP